MSAFLRCWLTSRKEVSLAHPKHSYPKCCLAKAPWNSAQIPLRDGDLRQQVKQCHWSARKEVMPEPAKVTAAEVERISPVKATWGLPQGAVQVAKTPHSMQGPGLEALVRDLDPPCHNKEFASHTKTKHSQIITSGRKTKATWMGQK